MGVANTSCTENGCKSAPFQLGEDWIKYFLVQDPSFSMQNMTDTAYTQLFRYSVQQHQSIIGTNDPDLSAFREAGGKFIVAHGLADEVVPVDGTNDYFIAVLALDENAADFLCFFPAPGVAHCASYVGPYPDNALASLVNWVEEDEAPDVLEATDLGTRLLEIFAHTLRYRYIQEETLDCLKALHVLGNGLWRIVTVS